MGLRQFVDSCGQALRSGHVNRSAALARHGLWQIRKAIRAFPVERSISHSVIWDDEPGGVISLVNMLGLYDYNNMSLLRRALIRGGVFFDVGANIGSYALVASENPLVRVHAFEPIPEAFRKLQHNIARNARSNVMVHTLAISSRNTSAQMTHDGAAATNRLVGSEHTGQVIEVRTETLSSICSTLKTIPTVLKVDVEGHELDVLWGAGSILREVDLVFVENGARPEICSLMEDQGFSGPHYWHEARGAFDDSPQARKEDEVFHRPVQPLDHGAQLLLNEKLL